MTRIATFKKNYMQFVKLTLYVERQRTNTHAHKCTHTGTSTHKCTHAGTSTHKCMHPQLVLTDKPAARKAKRAMANRSDLPIHTAMPDGCLMLKAFKPPITSRQSRRGKVQFR